MTNAEKFKEVFGYTIDDKFPDDPCTIIDHTICTDNNDECEKCELHDFWNKEFNRDMDNVSDGFHTFKQLYHQRAMLFAAIVDTHPWLAWKTKKHEDGQYCFDKNGEWFLVCIETPKGPYSYHYRTEEYWDLFNCDEIDKAKPFDGHTEKDVDRLLSLDPRTWEEFKEVANKFTRTQVVTQHELDCMLKCKEEEK